jgi:hypothetical protein
MNRKELTKKVYESVGTASVCWENLSGAGVFDDATALKVASGLEDAIDAYASSLPTGNILRELEKISHTLSYVLEYLEKTSEANAALHLSAKVMYSPLASSVSSAIQSLEVIRNEL